MSFSFNISIDYTSHVYIISIMQNVILHQNIVIQVFVYLITQSSVYW